MSKGKVSSKAVQSQETAQTPAVSTTTVVDILKRFMSQELSVADKKSAFAELKTTQPNVKVLRVKTRNTDSLGAYIALEGKRKGFMIRSTEELESLLAILSNPKLKGLIEAIEKVCPKDTPAESSNDSDDVLFLE